jgi:molecular chaperone GrpE (heat shock protein)
MSASATPSNGEVSKATTLSLLELRQKIDRLKTAMERLETIPPRLDQLIRRKVDRPDEAIQNFLTEVESELAVFRAQDDLRSRLFVPLRAELVKHQTAFVRDVLQKPFVKDLTSLDDSLQHLVDLLKRAAEVKRGRVFKWARGLDVAVKCLGEMLTRLEVCEIEPQEKVNPALHRVVSHEPTEDPAEDGKIVAQIKRGLIWKDQVLRREDVIAKRY